MKRRSLPKSASRLLVAGVVIIGGGLTWSDPAGAITKHECETTGGTFVKGARGSGSCEYPTTPPPEHASAEKFDTVTGKASTKSSHEQEEGSCVENNGGTHCH